MEAHELLRKALKRVLDEAPDLEVIGDMGNGNELFKFLEWGELVPNMLILDLYAPSLHGVEDMHRIKFRHPEVKVLVLSMHENQEYLHNALSNGAEGYLLKKEADTELCSAINKIRKGEIYTPPFLCES